MPGKLRAAACALALSAAASTLIATEASAGERSLSGSCKVSDYVLAEFEVRYDTKRDGTDILWYWWDIKGSDGNKNNVEFWLKRVGDDKTIDHWKSGDNVKKGRSKITPDSTDKHKKTLKKGHKRYYYDLKIQVDFDIRDSGDPRCTTTQGSIVV
jgi:hypothetical protein